VGRNCSTANSPKHYALAMTAEHPNEADDAEIVIGPREQLFHLLAEASEIEHTLMCSYLYAAFSLKSSATAEFSTAEADAVARWRKAIMGVATEEMSHLLMVANLSVAVGGRPHLGRPNFPVAPGYFPSGVVVRLTPFSLETLQHFIFLERPRGAPHRDGARFECEQNYQREEAFHGLMPSVQDYATVGALYEALRQNLIASARRVGESVLFIGPRETQVGADVVALPGVRTIGRLEEALNTIDDIVEQGEGAPDDREDSHYQRFRTMRKELSALSAQNPSFAPAWPAADSPVMRRPPEDSRTVFVEAHDAARVLDFANAIYSVLLRCLVQAFGREGVRCQVEQEKYIGTAIELMHCLSRAATLLASLPASEHHPGLTAGMTFTMLRGVEPFLQGSSERLLMRERLCELRDGAGSMQRAAVDLADLTPRFEKLLAEFGDLPPEFRPDCPTSRASYQRPADRR
jgi:hypothetical protein